MSVEVEKEIAASNFVGTLDNVVFQRLIETYVVIGELIADKDGNKIHPPKVSRYGQVRHFKPPTQYDCGAVLTMEGYFLVARVVSDIPSNFHGEKKSNGKRKTK